MLDEQNLMEPAGQFYEGSKKPGDKAPDFTAKNFDNSEFSLYQALKDGPVVLTIYRGHW